MLDRRTLLKEAAGLGGALWVAQAMRAGPVLAKATTAWTLSPPEIRTLTSLQDRLLPSAPASPGARDVNATRYLLTAAADATVTDTERSDLKRGLERLEQHARSEEKKAFCDLSNDQQDVLLRAFQKTPGAEAFMSLVLVYTLEALLGDPVYDVNLGGVGWTWLRHNPGFPRPQKPWRGGL